MEITELPSLGLIRQEITSLDNLLWTVVKYQDVQKNAEDALMEKCSICLEDLRKKNAVMQGGLQ